MHHCINIMDRRDTKYYEARAQTIDLEQITSDEYNREILRLLRDNDPNFTYLTIQNPNNYDDDNDFTVGEGDDLGWLGFFVGQSKSLTSLYIEYLPQDREQVDAFFRAIKHNRSIESLYISHDIGPGFQDLGSLLKNGIIESVTFRYLDIGLECARNIVLMLNQPNQLNAIKTLDLEESYFSDDAMAEIATALSVNPQLEELYLGDSSIGRNGCVALGNTLGSWRNPNLERLYLTNNSFDDEGLQALLAGMRNCRNLTKLALEGNESITIDGFSSLSTLFQSTHCHMKLLQLSSMDIGDEEIRIIAAGLASLHPLETLDLSHNSVGDDGARAIATGIASLNSLTSLDLSGNRLISAVGLRSLLLQSDSCSLASLYLRFIVFGDDGAAALADGLKGNNTSLKHLIFNPAQLTSAGWSSFSKLLCDTSSVNNTYLSNHTIKTIGDWCNVDNPDDVKQLLALNKRTDKHIAMLKILKSHPDFDVEPLCQWKLKLLPPVMSWFAKVDALVGVSKVFEKSGAIQSRKLSTLYKFIRGMPLVTIEGYRSHNNAAMSAHSRKRKISQL